MHNHNLIRPSRARLLSPAEHAALTRYCTRTSGEGVQRLFLLYTLIRFTGLRISEALQLTVRDVWDGYEVPRELAAHTAKQRGAKRRRNLSLCSDRDILRNRLKSWIKKLIAQHKLTTFDWAMTPLFCTSSRRPVDRPTITHDLYELCDRAQIARFSWHDLRHGYGQELYDHTGDVELVTAALGHTNPASTRHYLHPRVAKLHDVNIAIK